MDICQKKINIAIESDMNFKKLFLSRTHVSIGYDIVKNLDIEQNKRWHFTPS